MRTIQFWMPVVLCLALGACAQAETPRSSDLELDHGSAALAAAGTKPTSVYYRVRQDQRRCASPMCGGFWISTVNSDYLTCEDGKVAQECYVSAIEAPADIYAESGDLVQGTLVSRAYPELKANYGVLKADLIVSPVLETQPSTGAYYLGYDTGIRCIRSPCPSFGLAALNTTQSWTNRGFAFDTDNIEDSAALQAAFFSELAESTSAGIGSIAFGTIRRRYDRLTRSYRRELAISNVYVTKEAPKNVCLVNEVDHLTIAWNFSSREEADAFAPTLEGTVELMDGFCADASVICTLQYLPVHGAVSTSGDSCVEESNSCAFRAAVIRAAGRDGKASGSFTDGPCPVTP